MSDVLTDLFLWQGVTDTARDAMLAQLPPPQEYARGAVLYTADRFPRALGVVLCGELTVQRLSCGHERQQQRLPAGRLFGAAALFGGENYITEITAAKRSTVQLIPEELLRAWMRENGSVAENYVRFLTDRIRFLNAQLRDCTGGDAEERLWQYLRSHADSDGKLTRRVSWSTLAGQLGMGRSSLYRARDALLASGRLCCREQDWYILQTPLQKDTI